MMLMAVTGTTRSVAASEGTSTTGEVEPQEKAADSTGIFGPFQVGPVIGVGRAQCARPWNHRQVDTVFWCWDPHGAHTNVSS